MKYLITPVFVVLFNMLTIHAQSDFRSGYILNNDNDTIYGLIDYRGDKANAKKCSFKKDDDSEIQTFSPEEIKGYRFLNSKYYVSKNIAVGDAPRQLFLEYLINGVVDMYYYRDDGEHYLVDDGSGNLYELENKVKEIKDGNITYTKESKKYIGVLKIVFQDSPSISKRAEHTGLNHKSLIDITHDYHYQVCTGEECIIYEKKLPTVKQSLGVVVGVNGMWISQTGEFIDERLYYMEGIQFDFELFPSIGMFYKVNMPFINERMYSQFEGTYSRAHLKASGLYKEPMYSLDYYNNISVIQHNFNGNVIIKYEFPTGKIRPTFQVGGFVKYTFIEDYVKDLNVETTSGETYLVNQSKDSPFIKFDYGVSCGIGIRGKYVKEKELYLDLRYQRGFGMLMNLNTNAISLNLGLQLGK